MKDMRLYSSFYIFACVLVAVTSCGSRKPLVREDIVLENRGNVHGLEYRVMTADTIFAMPVPSLRGDSIAVPPLPPATSFHYVLRPHSDAPSSVPLVPVMVRRTSEIGYAVDSVRVHSEKIEKEVQHGELPVQRNLRFWKYAAGVLFLLLCFITYFLLRKCVV